MEYRGFGGTGWGVSAAGLGCWNLGNQWGELSDETARRIVRSAYDAGMNLFDIAESYGSPHGTSELRVGEAVDGFRDEVYLVTKIGHWGKRSGQAVPKTTADMIRGCGHACAGRLRTEYIDLLLCHEGNIEDPSVYIEGFRDLQAEGFVREYGISTNSVDVLERFYEASEGECAAVEVDYSLLNRKPEKELLPFCMEHDLGVLVRGPLARGVLTGKFDRETEFEDSVRENWNPGGGDREQFLEMLDTVAALKANLEPEESLVELALQYPLSHPAEPVVIPGATSPAQALQNATMATGSLSSTRRAALQGITKSA